MAVLSRIFTGTRNSDERSLDLVKIFRKRSRSFKNIAYVYLLVIIGSLGLAIALVFFAGRITVLDLSSVRLRGLDTLQERAAELSAQRKMLESKRDSASQKLIDALENTTRGQLIYVRSGSVAENHNPQNLNYLFCDVDTSKMLDLEQSEINDKVSRDTKNCFETNSSNKYQYFFINYGFANVSSSLALPGLATFETKLAQVSFDRETLQIWWKLTRRLQTLRQQEEDVTKAQESILQLVEEDTAQRLAGIAPQKIAPSVSPSVDLFQTTVTRFGGLAVLGFFVSILASLYRYSKRLEAFYDAQADAVQMCDLRNRGIEDFESILSALTPRIDFGKTPSTPLEQLVTALNALKALGKD